MAEITWPWQYNFPPFFTQWSYMNEGNVHIVIQLKGTEYVLRVIKEDGEKVKLQNTAKSVNYVNDVMVPLIFGYSDSVQEVIQILETDIKELSKALLPLRPEKRRFKSVLSKYAIKTQNLSLVHPKCDTNYCVEIKPKEGFIPSRLVEVSRCFYCLKQYLKLENNEIQGISKYCPLDLFSGDRERMKLALTSLTDNPQNNFKVFKDCQVIYNENSEQNIFGNIIKNMNIFKTSDNFIQFIIEVLLSNMKENITQTNPIERTALKQENCNQDNQLNTNSFLYHLLELQKLSDNTEIDHTKIPEGIEYVDELLTSLSSKNLDLSLTKDKETFLKTAAKIHLALISAVAKDCSIMISFASEYIEDLPYALIDGTKISFKLSVTDLEPKKGKTLIKRKETESQMIDLFQSKIQPNTETRAKQLEAWQQLITEYLKANKLSTIDIRESQNSPLFHNTNINRKLSQEAVLTVLESMAKTGKAYPIDKSKMVWEVYWHSLDEWGNMVYNWASSNGMTNSVCTLFELREGDNTTDEEFHGLDMNVLLKALKSLESKGKCELIEFDDNQGVKFF